MSSGFIGLPDPISPGASQWHRTDGESHLGCQARRSVIDHRPRLKFVVGALGIFLLLGTFGVLAWTEEVGSEPKPVPDPSPSAPKNLSKSRWQEALEFYARANYDEALRASEDALKEKPDSAEIYHFRSHLFVLKKDWDNAVRSAEKSLAIDPGNPEALAVAGWAHYAKGNYAKASDIFGQVLATGHRTPEIYADLASTLISMKEYGRAAMNAEEALKLRPDFLPARHLLGLAYVEEGKFPEAILLLDKLVGEEPDFLAAREALGRACLGAGDMKRAGSVFEDLLDKDPANRVAKEKLAELKKRKRLLVF